MTTRPEAYLAAAAFAAALVLGGCSNPPPVDCTTSDWEAVGFADGTEATGSGPTKRYAQCETFDRALWEQGYVAGLANYCTEGRIYRQARAGLSFPAVCAPRETELSRAYAHGRKYWELDLEMWRLRRRARDDLFYGQRLSKSAQYDALRRERAQYSRWPP
ncbi:MAG: DUF2799 domain-containing protein [Rhodobacteraceae bacterium]|nr:DUF2799 domain-containing protein [Paracoccaceae bacterium]